MLQPIHHTALQPLHHTSQNTTPQPSASAGRQPSALLPSRDPSHGGLRSGRSVGRVSARRQAKWVGRSTADPRTTRIRAVSLLGARPHGSTLFAAPLGRPAILPAVAPTTRSETRRDPRYGCWRRLPARRPPLSSPRARAPATRVGRSVDGGYAHTRVVRVGRSVGGSAHTKSLGSRPGKSAEGSLTSPESPQHHGPRRQPWSTRLWVHATSTSK